MTLSPTTSSLMVLLDGAPFLSTVTMVSPGKQNGPGVGPPDARRTHVLRAIKLTLFEAQARFPWNNVKGWVNLRVCIRVSGFRCRLKSHRRLQASPPVSMMACQSGKHHCGHRK